MRLVARLGVKMRHRWLRNGVLATLVSSVLCGVLHAGTITNGFYLHRCIAGKEPVPAVSSYFACQGSAASNGGQLVLFSSAGDAWSQPTASGPYTQGTAPSSDFASIPGVAAGALGMIVDANGDVWRSNISSAPGSWTKVTASTKFQPVVAVSTSSTTGMFAFHKNLYLLIGVDGYLYIDGSWIDPLGTYSHSMTKLTALGNGFANAKLVGYGGPNNSGSDMGRFYVVNPTTGTVITRAFRGSSSAPDQNWLTVTLPNGALASDVVGGMVLNNQGHVAVIATDGTMYGYSQASNWVSMGLATTNPFVGSTATSFVPFGPDPSGWATDQGKLRQTAWNINGQASAFFAAKKANGDVKFIKDAGIGGYTIPYGTINLSGGAAVDVVLGGLGTDWENSPLTLRTDGSVWETAAIGNAVVPFPVGGAAWNVNATQGTLGGKVTLTWDGLATGDFQYQIRRGTPSSGSCSSRSGISGLDATSTLLATLAGDARTYNDTTISGSTDYCYRVVPYSPSANRTSIAAQAYNIGTGFTKGWGIAGTVCNATLTAAPGGGKARVSGVLNQGNGKVEGSIQYGGNGCYASVGLEVSRLSPLGAVEATVTTTLPNAAGNTTIELPGELADGGNYSYTFRKMGSNGTFDGNGNDVLVLSSQVVGIATNRWKPAVEAKSFVCQGNLSLTDPANCGGTVPRTVDGSVADADGGTIASGGVLTQPASPLFQLAYTTNLTYGRYQLTANAGVYAEHDPLKYEVFATDSDGLTGKAKGFISYLCSEPVSFTALANGGLPAWTNGVGSSLRVPVNVPACAKSLKVTITSKVVGNSSPVLSTTFNVLQGALPVGGGAYNIDFDPSTLMRVGDQIENMRFDVSIDKYGKTGVVLPNESAEEGVVGTFALNALGANVPPRALSSRTLKTISHSAWDSVGAAEMLVPVQDSNGGVISASFLSSTGQFTGASIGAPVVDGSNNTQSIRLLGQGSIGTAAYAGPSAIRFRLTDASGLSTDSEAVLAMRCGAPVIGGTDFSNGAAIVGLAPTLRVMVTNPALTTSAGSATCLDGGANVGVTLRDPLGNVVHTATLNAPQPGANTVLFPLPLLDQAGAYSVSLTASGSGPSGAVEEVSGSLVDVVESFSAAEIGGFTVQPVLPIKAVSSNYAPMAKEEFVSLSIDDSATNCKFASDAEAQANRGKCFAEWVDIPAGFSVNQVDGKPVVQGVASGVGAVASTLRTYRYNSSGVRETVGEEVAAISVVAPPPVALSVQGNLSPVRLVGRTSLVITQDSGLPCSFVASEAEAPALVASGARVCSIAFSDLPVGLRVVIPDARDKVVIEGMLGADPVAAPTSYAVKRHYVDTTTSVVASGEFLLSPTNPAPPAISFTAIKSYSMEDGSSVVVVVPGGVIGKVQVLGATYGNLNLDLYAGETKLQSLTALKAGTLRFLVAPMTAGVWETIPLKIVASFASYPSLKTELNLTGISGVPLKGVVVEADYPRKVMDNGGKIQVHARIGLRTVSVVDGRAVFGVNGDPNLVGNWRLALVQNRGRTQIPLTETVDAVNGEAVFELDPTPDIVTFSVMATPVESLENFTPDLKMLSKGYAVSVVKGSPLVGSLTGKAKNTTLGTLAFLTMTLERSSVKALGTLTWMRSTDSGTTWEAWPDGGPTFRVSPVTAPTQFKVVMKNRNSNLESETVPVEVRPAVTASSTLSETPALPLVETFAGEPKPLLLKVTPSSPYYRVPVTVVVESATNTKASNFNWTINGNAVPDQHGYKATLTFTEPGVFTFGALSGEYGGTIDINVQPNQPPACELAEIDMGRSIKVVATCSDEDGKLKSAAWKVNGKSVTTTSNYVYVAKIAGTEAVVELVVTDDSAAATRVSKSMRF